MWCFCLGFQKNKQNKKEAFSPSPPSHILSSSDLIEVFLAMEWQNCRHHSPDIPHPQNSIRQHHRQRWTWAWPQTFMGWSASTGQGCDRTAAKHSYQNNTSTTSFKILFIQRKKTKTDINAAQHLTLKITYMSGDDVLGHLTCNTYTRNALITCKCTLVSWKQKNKKSMLFNVLFPGSKWKGEKSAFTTAGRQTPQL